MSTFSEPESPILRRTVLHEAHCQSGGKIVPFAGWEMPVQYSGVKNEVLALRGGCGVFDVSHMGQLDVRGENVTAALDAIVSADLSKVRVGRAAYALLLSQSAGILDDIMGYRLSENHWLVVVNASRAAIDEPHLRALLPPHIQISNRYANQAMIAIQGPRAEATLQRFCCDDLAHFAFRDVRETAVWNQSCVVARGGYTGCDGFEWMGDAASAPLLWQKLLGDGAIACGLGARDVLRMEAGLPLYGHELREDWTPDESGVAFAAKPEKAAFYGREALQQKRATPAAKAIRGLRMNGRAIAREGYAVARDDLEIGIVTSGTPSPTLEQNIALALLPADLPLGCEVDVLIRGASHSAQIVALPFVARTTKSAHKVIS